MGVDLGSAHGKIEIDASGVRSAVETAQGAFGGLGDVLKNSLGTAIGFLTAQAIPKLLSGMTGFITSAMEAQNIQAQLNAVLESTGSAAGVTADMANELANSLSQVTRFEDDTIVAGENMLLTFTNIGKDVFPAATETMLNMAQAMGGDLKGTAIQLGKALNDPVNGITALTRVGVTFTDAQKDMITKMVAAGDVAGAQKVILAELEKEFGGSAVAAGQTFAGQLDILKNALGNVGETVGTAVLPLLTMLLTTVIMPMLPALQALGTAIAYFVGVLSEGGGIGDAFDAMGEALAGTPLQGFGVTLYSIGGTLESVVGFIQTNVLPALSSFSTWFFTQGLPSLIAFITAIWVQLGPGLVQLWTWIQQLAAFALPLLQQAFQFVMDNWKLFAIAAGIITAIIIALNAPILFIIGILTLLATAWANDWGGIQEKTQAVLDFVVPYITLALTTIQAWWADHGTQVIATVTNLWTTVSTTVTTFLTAASVFISDTLAAIKKWWGEHGDEVIATVINLWNTVYTTVSTFLTDASVFISDTLANIKAWWSEHGDTVVSIVTKFINNVAATIAIVVGAIALAIAAFLTLVQTWWSEHGDAVMKIVGDFWTMLQDNFDTALTIINDLMDVWGDLVKGDWTKFGEDLQKTWDDLWAAITERLTTVWEGLKTLVSDGVTALVKYFTDIDWGGIGTSIIDGIKAGVESAAASLGEAAAAAAKAALDAAKKALGIKSPSKVMAKEVGLPMAQGIQQGWMNAMDGVSRNMGKSLSGMGGGLGLAAQGATYNTNTTYNLNARYANESQQLLSDRVRMLSIMRRR